MASQNFQPSAKENAFVRRKSDERVEVLGTVCDIYRAQDTYDKITYDEFDEPLVNASGGGLPTKLSGFVLVSKNSQFWETVGEKTGQEIDGKYPYIMNFRFEDDVRKLDLVDIAYTYAQAAGVDGIWDGEPNEPYETRKTRYKLEDRLMQGVNGTVQNQYYATPCTEDWE